MQMTTTALLGLHAETSIHAGAGAALDVVDLPIQREAHTGWPCIFGSAVKGALRAAATARKLPKIEVIFGPENGNSSDYGGALLVGDARLLLLPVRSLTGHFKWVTCPAVLRRLQRDAERVGLSGFTFQMPDVGPAQNGVPRAKALAADSALYLEEYKFAVDADPALSSVITAIAGLSGVSGFAQDLQRQFVLVSDEDFAIISRYATPVTPHVALDSKPKRVRTGALWYEETLPPETLLYVSLIANDARKPGNGGMTAAEVLKAATDELFKKPYLQVGGNETVGMGWCKIAVHIQQNGTMGG
ncbi:type III-B CRISPR module RAMP protein Cmr4 [Methylocaldum sp. 14B]|jgi:CRISPR-associated protein Cmr4|uniref:type III-B CRISPR module RAMP protein Cmr4 n=1 Tax=unclassified Methylocaldum TaxID=2622260 RepID=UPI00197C0366|nr:type III-B CRISPR module RAMP protein Cmr4 [Methylocaldum sp. 14B]